MALEPTTLFVAQQNDAAAKYSVRYEQLRDAIQAGLGKPTISPTRPDPATSTEGDLWWNDQTGQLYIFYVDPSGDRYWVTASPQGTPNAGFVSVSTLPPVSPEEGALWWKDDDGILYVYYTDPSGDQYWVDTNPMGTPVGASHTYVQDTAPDAAASTEGDFWFDSNTGVLYVYYTDANSSQWVSTTGFNGYGQSPTVFDFPTVDLVANNTTYTPTDSTLTFIWNGQGWAIQGTGGGGSGSYTLPIATAAELGGVRVGTGLVIDAATGVLSADGSGSSGYTLPPATTSVLGGVIVGSGLSVTGDGTTSVDIATTAATGSVRIGTGLAVTGAGLATVDQTVIPALASTNTFTGVNTFDENIVGNLTGNVTGDVTGSLSGTATQANILSTARTLWGQSFNGSQNVTGALTDVTSITGATLQFNGTTSIELKPDSDTGLVLFNGAHDVTSTFDMSDVTTNNTIKIPAGSGTLALTTSTVTAATKTVRTETTAATDLLYRIELGAATNTAGNSDTFIVTDTTRLTYNPSNNTLNNVGTVDASLKVKAPTGEFDDLTDGTSTTSVTALLAAIANQASVPSGAVFYFAASSAPAGYLECDGSAVSRTTYGALFLIIGITYGAGDGSTTFNLPDLRGQFIRGWANDGTENDQGRLFGSEQEDATAVNNLSLTDPGHNHPVVTASGTANADPGNPGQPRAAAAGNTSTQNAVTNITLDSSDTETRPVNVALLPCIKT